MKEPGINMNSAPVLEATWPCPPRLQAFTARWRQFSDCLGAGRRLAADLRGHDSVHAAEGLREFVGAAVAAGMGGLLECGLA